MRYLMLLLICIASSYAQKKSDFYTEDNKVNLYVFVGKKISIEEDKQHSVMRDNLFIAKYEVIENVFNDLKRDTITFFVSDHYGRPGFEEYDNVLLYVAKNKEKNYYYHEKYQFDSVILNSEGIWIGPHFDALKPGTKTYPMDPNLFKRDISGFSDYFINKTFIPPLYEVKDSIATAVRGVDVKALFEHKKETILKARGIFD